MVHDLKDLIFCNVTVSKNQSIRSSQLIVLVYLLLTLLAQLLLDLFFCGHIVIIGIDPYTVAVALNDRHLGLDPDVLPVSLLQAILKLIFLAFFADTAIQILTNERLIVRMHAGKGALLIHGPGVLMAHTQHF